MPNKNTQPHYRYYPRLSEVVTVDYLPEFLSFVQKGIEQVLDKVHYKNLQYSKSPKGDSASYSLDLVTKERLALNIPGTGCSFILNPDADQKISSFPVSIQYQWEILAFLRSFSLENFSFSPEEFYRIGLQVFHLSDEQVLAHIFNYWVEPVQGYTKYQQIAQDINQIYGTSLSFPENEEEVNLSTLIQEIRSQSSEPASLVLFAVYLMADDWNATRARLKEFYSIMVPESIEAYVKKIITPHARVTFGLSAGVEFPESFFRPVDPNTYLPLTTGEKTVFQFAHADLVYDLDKGFDATFELGGGLNYPAEILKSGLILTMDGLKLDLSEKNNIPEADLDGRPADFKGFYARKVALTLPQRWFQNEDNPNTTLEISGHDLLVGSGGISGTVGLEAVSFGTSTDGKIQDYFSQQFTFNYPVTLVSGAEKVEIINYEELKNQMNTFRDSGKIYDFKFPLTLNQNGKEYNFYDGDTYRKFLLSLFPETPVLRKKIGTRGFEIGFSAFDLRFRQSKVVESNIAGTLKIPGFTDENNKIVEIAIKGHLEENGNFHLTASTEKPQSIKFGDIFCIHLKSIELGKENNHFYIDAACEVEFLKTSAMGKLLGNQKISISRIRIWDNGRLDFKVDGGKLVLNRPLSLPLGPVTLSVTAIHFGSHERMHKGQLRKYNFFGFDGGIDIGILGIDARGDGVKFYYSIDDDAKAGKKSNSYLHISTVKLDLTIPGNSSNPTVVLNGMLTIPEPGTSPEYEGSIGFKMDKLRVSGAAEMKLAPKYPAFIVKASLEIPSPISMGFVSIYGFQGLIGYRYVAEKKAIGMTSENTWYEYYKAPEKGVGLDKFSGPEQTKKYNAPFSLGIGAIWGTSDGGYIFSANSMILLSLPSMFMIDARAKLLSSRVTFNEKKEPPFFAFIILGDNALEAGFGADYKLPDNGSLIELYAEIQARFPFKDISSWYINFGTREKPIKAKVLSLFTLKAYLMLSARGMEVGARGEFNFYRDFKVLKLSAYAYLELGGRISFRRPQIGAHFAAGIGIDIRLFGKAIHIYAHVNILLGVESPKPFLIYGSFGVKFKIRLFGLFKLKFKATISLKWELNKKVDTTPINPLTENPGIERNAVKGISMLTNESFDLSYLGESFNDATDASKASKNVIPLDTYLDLRTERSLLPMASNIGGVTNPAEKYVDLIPPKSSSGGINLRQVKHEYSLESVELQAYNSKTGKWVDYHPYKAMYPNDSEVDRLKIGYWQKSDNEYNTIRILGNSPFSYTEKGEPGWFIPEQYGITESTLFCAGKEKENQISNFLGKPLGTQYQSNSDLFFYSNEVSYRLLSYNDTIIDENETYSIDRSARITEEANIHNFKKSLSFKNYNSLLLVLPEPSVNVSLKLSTSASGLIIKCYAPFTPKGSSLVENKLVTEIYKTRKELEKEVSIHIMDDLSIINKNAVSVLEIIPQTENLELTNKIREEIAQLFENSHPEEGIDIELLTPENEARYNQLMQQLALLTSAGCEKSDLYDIYLQLLENFENTFFEPYEVSGLTPHSVDYAINKYIDFICSNFNSYEEVNLLLKNINPSLINQELIKNYNTGLNKLKEKENILWGKNSNPSKTEKQEFVNIFENLRSVLEEILKKLETKFTNKNYIVENLYEELKTKDFYNTTKGGYTSPFLNFLQNFISSHQEYNFLSTILHRQIKGIEDSCKGGRFAISTMNEACERILEIIKVLTKSKTIQNVDISICNLRDILIGKSYFEAEQIAQDRYFTKSPFLEYLVSFLNQNPELQYVQPIISGQIESIQNSLGTYSAGETLNKRTDLITKNCEAVLKILSDMGNCECKSSTLFHQVEWLSENDYQYNIHIPGMEAVQEDNKATIEGLTKYIQPIWRPDTLYRIQYKLKDKVQYNGKTKEHLFSVAYGFKTAGPLGHFHTNPDSSYGNITQPDGTILKESIEYPDKYPHTSLKQYIDYQRSYPNADGNIINAKPLFYDDETTEIRLHFIYNYMQQMFDGWKEYNGLPMLNGLFKIIIKDPAEDINIINPPRLDVDIEYPDIPQTEESWVNDEDPRIPAEIQQWINLAKANTCNLELGEMIAPPKSPLKIAKPKYLKPQKLYTAQVFNFYWKDLEENPENLSSDELVEFKKKYSQEIHKFVFQTSRYKDFEEQVSSCLLKDDANNSRLAEFSLKKELTQGQMDAISEEATVFFKSLPTTNLLSQRLVDQYPDPFERIMQGILELNPLDIPIGTEFNTITLSQTRELIALLIRNPEPFNHPKIPLQEIQDTVQVMNEEGKENTSYKTVFSKDYSQILLIRPNQKWEEKPITIRFGYKHWNGREYETFSYKKTLEIKNSTILNQIIIN